MKCTVTEKVWSRKLYTVSSFLHYTWSGVVSQYLKIGCHKIKIHILNLRNTTKNKTKRYNNKSNRHKMEYKNRVDSEKEKNEQRTYRTFRKETEKWKN